MRGRELYADSNLRLTGPCPCRLTHVQDMHPTRVLEAVRSLYTLLYGYHGPEVVSGFKEIRFGQVRPLPTSHTQNWPCAKAA